MANKGKSRMINVMAEIGPIKPTEILCIDIEGGPEKIFQISIVDLNEKAMCNTYTKNGVLGKNERKTIQNLLNKARILIGYSLNSDLTTLNRQDITLPQGIVCLDVLSTINQMIREGMINTNQLNKVALKNTASFFGISGVVGYHNALVDASATVKLYKRVLKQNMGKMTMIDPHIILLNEKQQLEQKASLTRQDDILYPIQDHFYEGVIYRNGERYAIRMTEKEWKLYQKNRKFSPLYTLADFYSSVVEPGILYRAAAYKEQEAEEEKLLQGDINSEYEAAKNKEVTEKELSNNKELPITDDPSIRESPDTLGKIIMECSEEGL